MNFFQFALFILLCQSSSAVKNKNLQFDEKKTTISVEQYIEIKHRLLEAGTNRKRQDEVLEHVIKLIYTEIERISKKIASRSSVDAADIKSAMVIEFPSIFKNANSKMNENENNAEIEQETVNFNRYLFKSLWKVAKYFVFKESTRGLSSTAKILYKEWCRIKDKNIKSDIYSEETKAALKDYYYAWLDSLRESHNKKQNKGQLRQIGAAGARRRQINFQNHYNELTEFVTRKTLSLDQSFDDGKSKADIFLAKLSDPFYFTNSIAIFWGRYTATEKSIIMDWVDSGSRYKYVCAMIIADEAVATGYDPYLILESTFGISNQSSRDLIGSARKTFETIFKSPPAYTNPKWNSLDWSQKLKIFPHTATVALEFYKKGYPDPFIDGLIDKVKSNIAIPGTVHELKNKFLNLFWGRFSPEQQKILLNESTGISKKFIQALQKADEGVRQGNSGNQAVAEYFKISSQRASALINNGIRTARIKIMKAMQ